MGLLTVPFSFASPGSQSFGFLRFLALVALVVAPALLLAAGVSIAVPRFRTGGPGDGAAEARRASSRRAGLALVVASLAGGLVSADAFLVEPTRLQVARFRVAAPSRARLERPLRIALVTDLQADRVGEIQARALREAAAFRPDLLLFGGDFLQVWTWSDYSREADRLRPLLREAAGAARFSFAVWGNVDPRDSRSRRNAESLLFDGTGIQVLVDATRDVEAAGVAVRVTGLDLATGFSNDPGVLSPLLPSPPQRGLHLVLAHAPDFAREAAPLSRVDLALAGHTHGGQVALPFFGPPITFSRLPRETASGLHLVGGLPLIVSRGVGMERHSAPRVRFLCPPDVALVEMAP